MKFNLGDTVEWTSQSQGYTKTKRGVIIEVVPPNTTPHNKIPLMGMSRNHESYIVKVKSKLYCARVKLLKLADQPKEQP